MIGMSTAQGVWAGRPGKPLMPAADLGVLPVGTKVVRYNDGDEGSEPAESWIAQRIDDDQAPQDQEEVTVDGKRYRVGTHKTNPKLPIGPILHRPFSISTPTTSCRPDVRIRPPQPHLQKL